jgi:hypothetical protein
LDPDDSNPMIQAWLAGFEPGADFPNNNATPDQVAAAIALLQTGVFNVTPEQLDGALAQLEDINPALPALAVNAGFLTDPGYLAFINEPGTPFEPVYGGWNPALVLPGILDLFGIGDEASDVSQVVDPTAFDLSALFGGFDPASLDLGALFGGYDPAAVSTEVADLLEDLTAAWVPDLAASALTVF